MTTPRVIELPLHLEPTTTDPFLGASATQGEVIAPTGRIEPRREGEHREVS
jgi:hypothetical protein